MKLVGTTKPTIQSIRDRTHWNSVNIKPVDPVTLGLVGQLELDEIVRKAAEKKAREDARRGPSLRPASETAVEPGAVDEEAADVDAVIEADFDD
jgi:hypothetical protein